MGLVVGGAGPKKKKAWGQVGEESPWASQLSLDGEGCCVLGGGVSIAFSSDTVPASELEGPAAEQSIGDLYCSAQGLGLP